MFGTASIVSDFGNGTRLPLQAMPCPRSWGISVENCLEIAPGKMLSTRSIVKTDRGTVIDDVIFPICSNFRRFGTDARRNGDFLTSTSCCALNFSICAQRENVSTDPRMSFSPSGMAVSAWTGNRKRCNRYAGYRVSHAAKFLPFPRRFVRQRSVIWWNRVFG